MTDRASTPDPGELQGLDAGELLARALQTARPSGGAHAWVPPTVEELACLLPQYRIESLIGRGGMGAVYKAVQPELGRPVAIKLLGAELAADEEFVARFKREARTLAQLQHSRIITIHDTGQTSEGHLYFVMEYIDGTDLRSILRGPGLSPEQALLVVGQLCDALQAAHARGVVHRDIKPENVLITQEGYVKLADFGLARPSHGDGVSSLTHTNAVMGTPDYMAPEQHAGAANADHRSDIFSLGVMFYEMLTGLRPRGVFDAPSRKVQIDVRIDEVVLKALQSEPERRYQKASEMKTDVEKIRSSPPAPPVSGKASPTVPPHPAPSTTFIAVSAVAVLLVVAGLAGMIFSASRKAGSESFPQKLAGADSPADPPAIPAAPPARPEIHPPPVSPVASPAPSAAARPAEIVPPITPPPIQTMPPPVVAATPKPEPPKSTPAPPVEEGLSFATGFERPDYPAGRFRRTNTNAVGDGHGNVFGGGGNEQVDRAIQVQSRVVRTGSQALVIDAGLGKDQTGIELTLENSEPYVVINADLFMQSSSKQTDWCFMGCDPEAGETFSVTGFNVFSVGHLQMTSPGWPQNLTQIPRDTWTHLELQIDLKRQVCDVFINGRLAVSKVAFVAHTTRVRMFRFGTFGGGNDRAYLDNFSFKAGAKH